MALRKTVTTVHGLTCTDAYHRVENLTLTQKDQVSFFVRSYANTANKPFNETVIYSPYDLDGANPLAQAYQHLKTQPEFAGATDC